MDALSRALEDFALQASVFLHADFCGAWAVDTSGDSRATFHMVAGGTCWLHQGAEREPIALGSGDLVVFPHDAVHTLTDSPTPPPPSLPRNQPCTGAVGAPTTLICGYFDFGERRWNPLLDALPEMILVRSEDIAHTQAMEGLIRFLIYESEQHQTGGAAVVNKLAEVLFIHVLRCYLHSTRSRRGYLAALADRHVGHALALMHSEPGRPWRLAQLAELVGLSRSAFAQRFAQLVGETPMHYLSRWRMQQAYRALTRGDASVGQVARDYGYASEASFGKAFKQVMGLGPGEVRRRARQGGG